MVWHTSRTDCGIALKPNAPEEFSCPSGRLATWIRTGTTESTEVDIVAYMVEAGHLLDGETRLRALADPTRLELCRRLAAEELCVCHLVEDMGLGQSLLSHHLGVLREARLVVQRRHSYWTYYRLDPEAFELLAEEFDSLAQAAKGPLASRPCS